MPNRLANETSPYLLQHKDNPVDWYPWGPEALARSKELDRPILLSIGYSACHWCHVMEHESFEDAQVASVMNRWFINIKVDREERPDLDELYMRAVQAFTGGHGGWPMTVFLTPEGKPFFGGTYFPPRPARGMPSFTQVLDHVRNLWATDKAKVAEVTGKIGGYLTSAGRLPRAEGALSPDWLERIAEALDQDFDEEHAGFGKAPKFPPHGSIAALLAHWKRGGDERAKQMALTTLEAMARGGMYDLVGGGFARYSVDTQWLIPHFEKMLYDNAQLVPLYVDAYKITKDPSFLRVVRESLGWIRREMTAPEGGFHSSLDADSEGEEGKFYVWTPPELRAALGFVDGMAVSTLLGVTDAGNFEHATSALRMEVPRERLDPETCALVEGALAKLREVRETRVRPGRDDKIVTAWNALTVSAFARAAAILPDEGYVDTAVKAAEFLLNEVTSNGRLQRTWKDGRAHIPGFADDHAFLVDALVDLYEATFDLRWLREANRLADTLVALFWDTEEGGLYYTGHDAERLLTRSKHLLGGAEPSANGVAARAFARLADLCGRDDLGEYADQILKSYQPLVGRAPRALGVEALAAAWRTGATGQVGLVGEDADFERIVRTRYLPFAVVARITDATPPELPWMEGKTAHGGPTAYVCEDHACLAPVTTPDALEAQLDHRATARTPGRMHAPALPSDPDAWIGSAPLSLADLRGNIVVLDFWTYCCINCLHVLPELAKLEASTAGEAVVVIGVHSAKFATERERESVVAAVGRNNIRHPVVLDGEHTLWDAYTVRSWPTIIVLDVDGRVAWQKAGEVAHDELLAVVRRLQAESGEKLGVPAFSPVEQQVFHGLRYPGKVSVWPEIIQQAHGADPLAGGRMYVSDTGNHQIVEAELSRGPDGWPVARRLRTFGGEAGFADGVDARFTRPQGTARVGDTLWVADTENHAIRRIDLDSGEVTTVAGTGRLGRGLDGDGALPRRISLRSPWDIAASTNREGGAEAVFIAMAGMHQLWVYLPADDQIGPLCGSGVEDHVDGPPADAALAQPSGLSLVGRYLFFADSETSSIRVFDLGEHKVGTLLGRGLFDFGDVDGTRDEALLQHPLAVCASEGFLYVADTYNHKLKAVDLRGGTIGTVATGFAEPGGLALCGDFILVADTNNHRIAAVHRATGEVRTVDVG